MTEKPYTISGPVDDSDPCPAVNYTALPTYDGELCAAPDVRWHEPRRNWKKSQKKLRRERRRR
ncbi:MAG: hypothetical protein J6V72_12525 [Kiritimatiellae bacterium]|nr:hypothetical protein [Kiritimatiellia bacterium]